MSRSLGGRSLTISPPIKISPAVTSSSPAIIRNVVLLPQPDGPTRTTNSLSGISRLMLRTASTLSNRLTTLRSETSAMTYLALGGAGGETGDVIVHQKSVDHERRRRGEERASHQHSPFIHVGADQARYGANGEDLLVRRVEERHRIHECRPGHRESENHGGDDPGQCYRNENLGQHLHVARAIDQRRLVQLLGDRLEITDHDPGAERHRECRVNEHHAPIGIEQADGFDDLKQGNEQQGIWNEIGQENTRSEKARAPKSHPSE